MRADLLTDAVAGLEAALEAVDAFDQVLAAGLLRPGPAQAAGLTALAGAVTGTPLASRTAEAAEKAAGGAAAEDDFLALAAGRTALLGSVHDALMSRIGEATGRESVTEEAPGSAGASPANLLNAARSWLCDVARAGWQGLDRETVAGAAPVVSALLPDTGLRRLAVLLDGFAAELAASAGPGAPAGRFPLRRWADLWARGLILTVPGAISPPRTSGVTGRLLPLGVDLTEHANAVQAQVHAILEPAVGGPPRLVRAAASAPKPDTVIGAGLWQLLRPHLSLLAAVSEGRSMDLEDMPVTAEGDLIWDDARATPGEPADPLATARVTLPTAADPRTAPLDRHPARIAVPVFLEAYTVAEDGTCTVTGCTLPVDAGRAPAAGPLTAAAVKASTACVGLLRWDDGTFRLQPLAVETTVKKRKAVVGAGDWGGGTADKAGLKAEKAAADARTVLSERAGRLLRKR